jgi:hypothetical protein
MATGAPTATVSRTVGWPMMSSASSKGALV